MLDFAAHRRKHFTPVTTWLTTKKTRCSRACGTLTGTHWAPAYLLAEVHGSPINQRIRRLSLMTLTSLSRPWRGKDPLDIDFGRRIDARCAFN